jgi:hypothetical protein
MGVSLVKTSWGKMRAPTWFEVRAKLGDPNAWPFKVRSGIYPPTEGEKYSHTHMNHDNSQLFYDNASQVTFHNTGPVPAGKSASEHQLFAVNSAAGASIEWVKLLMTFPKAKEAIEYARSWDVKKFNPAMEHDLENGLTSTLFMSCVKYKWDGNNPPQQRKTQCSAGLSMGGAGTALAPFTMGATGVLPTPANEFWGVEIQQNIVDHLTTGFGGADGNYAFDPVFIKTRFPKGIPQPDGESE